ncbi:hypothetical protein A2U01_0101530, partial [Trifolium medium]|nr:hypothetical protein [Trifolium medium]
KCKRTFNSTLNLCNKKTVIATILLWHEGRALNLYTEAGMAEKEMQLNNVGHNNEWWSEMKLR